MIKEAHKDESINEGYIKKILDYLLLRVRFRYGYKEIIHYLMNCICLRKMEKSSTKTNKTHLFY